MKYIFGAIKLLIAILIAGILAIIAIPLLAVAAVLFVIVCVIVFSVMVIMALFGYDESELVRKKVTEYQSRRLKC